MIEEGQMANEVWEYMSCQPERLQVLLRAGWEYMATNNSPTGIYTSYLLRRRIS
jgi:hypothetical protein